jgi:hypothetical protein
VSAVRANKIGKRSLLPYLGSPRAPVPVNAVLPTRLSSGGSHCPKRLLLRTEGMVERDSQTLPHNPSNDAIWESNRPKRSEAVRLVTPIGCPDKDASLRTFTRSPVLAS